MKTFIELEVDKQYFTYNDSNIIIFKIAKISNYADTIEYERKIIDSNDMLYNSIPLSYFLEKSAFHSYIVGETTANTIEELKELNPEYFI